MMINQFVLRTVGDAGPYGVEEKWTDGDAGPYKLKFNTLP